MRLVSSKSWSASFFSTISGAGGLSCNLGRRPLRRARSSAELRRLAVMAAAAEGAEAVVLLAGLLFDLDLFMIFLVSGVGVEPFFSEGARLRVRDEGEPLLLRVAAVPKRADRLRGLLLPPPRGGRPLLDMLGVGALTQ